MPPVVDSFGDSAYQTPALSNLRGMVQDLKAISSIAESELEGIRQLVTGAQGFLSPEKIEELVLSQVPDKETAGAVARALHNISHEDVEDFILWMENQRKENSFPFNPEEFELLKQALAKLIQPNPAIIRYQKAASLTEIIGDRLASIELICEIRPIFNEDRSEIDGLLPYTRLQIVSSGSFGLPKTLEVELTRQQVVDLADKANKANVKLNVLYGQIRTWMPNGLPDMPATRQNDS